MSTLLLPVGLLLQIGALALISYSPRIHWRRVALPLGLTGSVAICLYALRDSDYTLLVGQVFLTALGVSRNRRQP